MVIFNSYVSLPRGYTMNQTTNRPTNQSTNQSTSQPINESINQLTQASCIAQLKSTRIIHPSRNGNHKQKQHNWNLQPSTLIGTVHWYVVYVPQSIDLFWRCSRQLEPTHPNLTHPVHIRTLQCLMFHVEEITCARHSNPSTSPLVNFMVHIPHLNRPWV